MKDLETALILGSEGVQGEFLRQERRNWLPLLIPPLVHSLNNSLLVVMGSGSPPASEADRAGALVEYRHMVLALRTLSMFAKPHGKALGSIEVSSLLAALHCLATPFARTQGVELEFRIPGRELVAHGSPQRLQQWALCLLLGLIHELDQRSGREARARGEGQGVPRLRVSAQQQGECLNLKLSLDRVPGDGQPTSVFLAAHGGWLRESGIRCRERQLGRVGSLQLSLPLPQGAGRSLGVQEVSQHGSGELTLVESDATLRELLRDLFCSENYRVRALGGVQELPDALLRGGPLVLDLESLRSHPALWHRIGELRADLGAVLLLGDVSPGELKGPWAGVRSLAKTSRPAQLLEQVRALF